MEEIMLYGGIVVVTLAGVWTLVKRIVALTPTLKDDEAIAKAEPFVDTALELGGKLTGKDVPSEGQE